MRGASNESVLGRTVSAAALAMMTALSGCSLIIDSSHYVGERDASVGDAAVDNGINDFCSGAQPPLRATTADAPGSETYAVVLRDMVLDQSDANGGDPLDAPWRTIGFNLDGFCTTTQDLRSECAPDEGFSVPLDGTGGIDNAFGSSLFPLLALGAEDLEGDVAANQRDGIGNVMLIVDDWNGELDDSRVTVTFATTVFGTEAGAGGSAPDLTIVGSEAFLADGTTPAPSPSWDGTDYFWGRRDMFVAGDPALPNIRVTTAYVTGGVLVVRLPDRSPVKLVGIDQGIEVTLTDSVLVGNIYELFVTPQGAAPAFVMAGRWGVNDIVAQAEHLGICDGTPLHSTFVNQVGRTSDVLQDPPATAEPSLPCDALSVGIAFDGYAARFGGVAQGQDIPSPCPP